MQRQHRLAAMLDEITSLRRYLRALTGSQAGGDALIEMTQQALVTAMLPASPEAGAKRALFQFFYARIWPGLAAYGVVEGADAGKLCKPIAEVRSALEVPASRQADILRAVEKFTKDDVDAILYRLRSEGDGVVVTLAEQAMARVLIIEDEPIIAMDIEMIVGDLGHVVVGIATTRNEALDLARSTSPDLILSDIHLADGSNGIDVVGMITMAREVPVVFITAFPESLLIGRPHEPAFLITKPFQPAAIEAIITQALAMHRLRNPMN